MNKLTHLKSAATKADHVGHLVREIIWHFSAHVLNEGRDLASRVCAPPAEWYAEGGGGMCVWGGGMCVCALPDYLRCSDDGVVIACVFVRECMR